MTAKITRALLAVVAAWFVAVALLAGCAVRVERFDASLWRGKVERQQGADDIAAARLLLASGVPEITVLDVLIGRGLSARSAQGVMLIAKAEVARARTTCADCQ